MTIICFEKRVTPLERAHETEKNDTFLANDNGIAPAHSQSVVLVSKYYL